METVAEDLGITRRQLERAMRVAGTTPHSYLISARLERAVQRLSDPLNKRRTIADIACDSGFSALSVFSKACRDKYDASPGQIRQRGRQPHDRHEFPETD
ncbi:helix-turn-helix transcriptional regulator [Nocardia sp. NPDC020380]|uniref:helix-turn-helix transcriptional regulator n=1 Tax=Nocardia sp. NPDC020380 TaxID=3364309 RepID=UPI0037A2243B